MNATRLLGFRRSHLRDPVLRDEASAAAMEEEGARVRAQNAAAWQWLMRGGGPGEAPLPAEPAVRGPLPLMPADCRPLSRFAHEAALHPRLCLLDHVDLASLAAARHRRQKLGLDQASRRTGYAEKKATMVQPSAEKKATMVQSSDRRGLHLHFLAFQKLLRKLLPSTFPRKSMASAPATIKSDSEEEAQHHNHSNIYHHHHYHHHYYYGGEGYPVDDACLIKQPHLSTVQTGRRRHSESGLERLAQQYPLWAESEGQNRQIEEKGQRNEFVHVEEHFSPTFSNSDSALWHPMKPSPASDGAVKTQKLINLHSPPIQRTASERFTDATSVAQFSLKNYETQSRIARCNSERRQPLHLQNNFKSVDAQSNYLSSGQFFDSTKWRSPYVAAGAMMTSQAKQRPRRHSATVTAFPV